ncbi:type II toxin-antitoxin system RatA family toxin [Ottowia sp.]|uniref:type II toxin-antitoxin system RatA family toxin n=1 Tax=Ottowia sp. TaxID=1898956 RepID=UPI002C7A692D|nr:type II toxin-antitoxin system RatA family toxin [Ottowia sp.]HOB66054.1 type II toxin-antitoxin system RatA family toxin [Ottowia sp.]HPZ56046.1 type II toxin-antitoxin system RatA family toxin [Ottowia sp.]HQD49452.1 type II toxin-antitoxin system RatA family toxin [Ottowia sp.]
MKSVHKSVLIWYTAQEMFDLVIDVERYPDFLPWCDHGKVLERQELGLTAEVGIDFKGVRQVFVTRNEHVPGREVKLHLVEGPFSKLEGTWQFTPVREGERACRVDLKLDYGFSNRLLATLVGPVFDKIANSLVDAFVQRAEQVYGSAVA